MFITLCNFVSLKFYFSGEGALMLEVGRCTANSWQFGKLPMRPIFIHVRLTINSYQSSSSEYSSIDNIQVYHFVMGLSGYTNVPSLVPRKCIHFSCFAAVFLVFALRRKVLQLKPRKMFPGKDERFSHSILIFDTYSH